MADTAVATPEQPTEAPTPEQALGQTTLEHDGRSYTGTGTDEAATTEAFLETTVGRKAESAAIAEGKKPIRGQKRFDQLTFEREEAKREADKARSEAAALKAELESLRTKSAPSDVKQVEAKSEPAQAETKTKSTAKRPTLEDFLDQQDPLKAYNDALSTYYESQIAEQIDARLGARLEADRASRQLTQTVADTKERGKSAYRDFEAVLSKSDVALPEPILWAVYHDPNAEHIIYALASDDDLAKEVAQMRDPLQLGRVLGRLGSVGASAPSPASSAPAKSQAPRPFQPVSGASRTASKSLQELAESGDVDAYKARRHAEMGIKAR